MACAVSATVVVAGPVPGQLGTWNLVFENSALGILEAAPVAIITSIDKLLLDTIIIYEY
jgi:hypothetical protein